MPRRGRGQRRNLLIQTTTDQLDSEIQRLENELARKRKERTVLQLQNQLAEENQRLQNLRQTLLSSIAHVPSDSTDLLLHAPEGSGHHATRGIKRSRSESMELEISRDDGAWVQYCDSGRSLPVTTIYEGTSRKEFTSFKRKLAEHFSTDSLFFEHDNYRVREALRHVSQSLADRWMIHSQGTGNESWLQFHSFLDQQLPTTRYTASYAESLYQQAQQRENQSVHQFMRHLGGLEAVMPHLFDEAERSHKLWEGTLSEICQISELHPNKDSFHALVASLEKAEASLPERVRALGGTIPPRGHPNRKRSKRRRR